VTLRVRTTPSALSFRAKWNGHDVLASLDGGRRAMVIGWPTPVRRCGPRRVAAPAREAHLWHEGERGRAGAPEGGSAGRDPAQRIHAGPPPGGHCRLPALAAGPLAGHRALSESCEGRARASPEAAAIPARRRRPTDWVAAARGLTPPSSTRSPARSSSPKNTCARTVVGSSRCSVCEVVELRGRQTACSAACRRERSRRRGAERWRARDREIAALLEAALRKLEKGSP
jgi:hypothetical protein